MPSLTSHLGIALDALQGWTHPVLQRNLGSYLLGSTAPDMRILTRQPRHETHFAPLDSESVEAGILGLFAGHPRLSRAGDLPEPTQAFVAGYMTHLVSDQVWILDMYHPFFGNAEVFEDRAVGNVMDRAVQLEMDRQDRPVWETAIPLLNGAEECVAVEFISPGLLREWREWLQEHGARGFRWERLHYMVRRQYPEGNARAQEAAERFLRSAADGLEWVYQRVSPARLQQFRERSIQEMTRVMAEYLQ